MKKTCLLIAIILFGCAVVGLFSCDKVFSEVNTTGDIVALKSGNKIVGAKLNGEYFGDINVSVSIFDYDGVAIDFNINSGELSSAQQDIAISVKNVLVSLSQYAQELNELCAPFEENSDICRYNNANSGQTIGISETTYAILKIAQDMYNKTSGLFNPCLFRSVDLWGFSPRFFNGTYKKFSQEYDRVYDYDNATYSLPDEKFVNAFCQENFISFDEESVKIFEDGGKYYITKNVAAVVVDGIAYNQWIDLGGITKGFFCDYAQSILEANNISCYYIDAGESSICFGKNYNESNFTIPFVNPFNVATSAFCIDAVNGAISSSGNYERYYTVDGQRYCHIIDAKTGMPTNSDVCGVSVVNIDCEYKSAVADCLTTALSCLDGYGLENFLNSDFAKDNSIEIIAFLQTTDGTKQVVTNLEQKRLVDLDEKEFAFALTDDGQWQYDKSAKPKSKDNNVFAVVLICLLIASIVTAVLFCVLKRGKPAFTKGRPQSPFARGDIFVALVLCTIVIVLFAVTFNSNKDEVSVVNVVDTISGETIFCYNIKTNKYEVAKETYRGWICNITEDGTKISVTITSSDGKENSFVISRSKKTSVQMVQASCGLSHDCIKVFGKIDSANSSIVCKPNGIKIIVN